MDDYIGINLPDLSFKASGVNYALDTNEWGREHKMVRGAYAKGFGYNIPLYVSHFLKARRLMVEPAFTKN